MVDDKNRVMVWTGAFRKDDFTYEHEWTDRETGIAERVDAHTSRLYELAARERKQPWCEPNARFDATKYEVTDERYIDDSREN